MTNLKDVQKMAEKFDNNELLLAKELKRVASVKCRLKKQKGKATYQAEMTATVQYEQVLKEARQLLNPKEKTVTMFDQDDVLQLDYDETVKAIRSIQSKKTLTKWLTDTEGDNDEFRKACEIESWLVEHRKEVAPIEDTTIRKTELITIIDTIESSGKLSQDKIVELLKSLI